MSDALTDAEARTLIEGCQYQHAHSEGGQSVLMMVAKTAYAGGRASLQANIPAVRPRCALQGGCRYECVSYCQALGNPADGFSQSVAPANVPAPVAALIAKLNIIAGCLRHIGYNEYAADVRQARAALQSQAEKVAEWERIYIAVKTRAETAEARVTELTLERDGYKHRLGEK